MTRGANGRTGTPPLGIAAPARGTATGGPTDHASVPSVAGRPQGDAADPASTAFREEPRSQRPFAAPLSAAPAPTPMAARTSGYGTLAARQTQTLARPIVPVVPTLPAWPVREAPRAPMGWIAPQFPEIGTILTSARGSYQVHRTLGSGNFGAVYDSIGPFDQAYALKMVRPANRPYAEVHDEWAKEVKRLQSLRHPNVVYIYDAFEAGGLFYLALERCDHPLSAMLGRPMLDGLVLELARQMLAAVQFLHDNDVVHDDLHAGNVLITQTDRPQVKISDFGISKELYGMAAVRPNVVHHAIMAPEILASGYTSRQSDLYQMGLVLFHMVTGTPAIDTGAPYEELARQIAAGDPRRRAEALGTPLGGVIAKMLRRREAYRFASAREVWAEFRELDAWKQRSLFPVK